MYVDLVIVGVGMVGSVLVLVLEGSGLEVLLVDGGLFDVVLFKLEVFYELWVSVLFEVSWWIFQCLYVWDGIVVCCVEFYCEMQVWDGFGIGWIGFSVVSVYVEVFGYIVENWVVQDVLLECLYDFIIGLLVNVCLEQMCYFGDDWLLILVDGCQLCVLLVVVVDGVNLVVCCLVGCVICEWDYLYYVIVISVCCENVYCVIVWQCFIDDGLLVFLFLLDCGDEYWCLIVWLIILEQVECLMVLDEDGFCVVFGEVFEQCLGVILYVDWCLCILLCQWYVKCYVELGLVLVGDVVYIIYLLVGQGVNLGFFDVVVLFEVLLYVLECGEWFVDECVLSCFEWWWMLYNLGMMMVMEGFECLFQVDWLLLCWLCNVGLCLVDGYYEVKVLFVCQVFGFSGDLLLLV